MPELPEVETVRRGLALELKGRSIEAVRVSWPGAVGGDVDRFSSLAVGRRFESFRRRGKLLVLDLDADLHLLVHLRMSGRLWLPPEDVQPDKHTHIVFFLDDGRRLHFRDVRKFGRCLLLDDAGLAADPLYSELGPEPLEEKPKSLADLLEGSRATLKSVLLDQRTIAGVGNIYADEALFRARLHPSRRASEVDREALVTLGAKLQDVLNDAIDAGGSTLRDYVTAQGAAGEFQADFKVYGRAGKPCVVCGTELVKNKVAGRTTTFCPRCQPPSKD